jgi:AraC-like DNA-binding protein
MLTLINLLDEDSYPLQDGLPAGYRGLIFHGATQLSFQTKSGMVVFQEFRQADFAIHLGVYKFLHMIRCILRPQGFSIGSFLALKNNFKCSIEGIGLIRVKEGHFNFIKNNKENIETEFRAGKEYQMFEISCSEEMVAQTLHYFPRLAKQFEKTSNHLSSHVLLHNRFAGDKVLSLVNDILNSPFNASINKIYFEYKVREYLLLLMAESSKTEEPKIFLSKAEKDRFEDLAVRLQQDPNGKFPITPLAREMGMNEIKLKLGFKQIFGKGIFKYHLDQRMKEAHRLLKDSGLPIKTIASLVGYSMVTSFITRFREYFGYPPSQIQKKS